VRRGMLTDFPGARAEERTLFGGAASPAVARLLHEAAHSYAQTQRAEAILWTAQAIDPHCLPVYFALYKFYFYKRLLHDAERVTRMALSEAARQGCFDPEWRRLTPGSADWDITPGPQHFYLFSLKALSFICLRQGRSDESATMLAKLQELDPRDRVGGSVIRDLERAASSSCRPAQAGKTGLKS